MLDPGEREPRGLIYVSTWDYEDHRLVILELEEKVVVYLDQE